MRVGKVWGSTELLERTPFFEAHRLIIKPNSRCSLHRHNHKSNAFYCESGRLLIEVHKNSYALVDTTELLPGQFTTVKPGEYHRFITGNEPATALEMYYPEPLGEDIERKDVGGPRKAETGT